jgi:hypothetical protein
VLRRASNRKVELRDFPKEEWARLITVSDRVRSTVRFADASGKPRPPEAHLRRLEKLKVPNLGVGGVLGVRHYHPDLDLVGTPNLAVSLHAPGGDVNLDFVEKLDPALKRVRSPFSPAHLVVHVLRGQSDFFQPRKAGLAWADPVECLLDLHGIPAGAAGGGISRSPAETFAGIRRRRIGARRFPVIRISSQRQSHSRSGAGSPAFLPFSDHDPQQACFDKGKN